MNAPKPTTYSAKELRSWLSAFLISTNFRKNVLIEGHTLDVLWGSRIGENNITDASPTATIRLVNNNFDTTSMDYIFKFLDGFFKSKDFPFEYSSVRMNTLGGNSNIEITLSCNPAKLVVEVQTVSFSFASVLGCRTADLESLIPYLETNLYVRAQMVLLATTLTPSVSVCKSTKELVAYELVINEGWTRNGSYSHMLPPNETLKPTAGFKKILNGKHYQLCLAHGDSTLYALIQYC
jgi:hypothetical protein